MDRQTDEGKTVLPSLLWSMGIKLFLLHVPTKSHHDKKLIGKMLMDRQTDEGKTDGDLKKSGGLF